jgi:hypothetical protein
MNLSQLKNPTANEWFNFLVAIAVWAQFVALVPCELSYPSDVLVKFLGILSPFFWYKSLNIGHRTEREREIRLARALLRLNRPAASRLIYFIVGALAWSAFVFNIPPDKSHETVTRDAAGFLAPLLLLARLWIHPDLSPLLPLLAENDSGHAHEPRFSNTVITLSWILFFFSGVFWIYFVDSLPGQSIIGFLALVILHLAVPWALSVGTKRGIAARNS